MAKKDFTAANKAFDALAEAVQLPGQLEIDAAGNIRKDRKTYQQDEAAAFTAQGKTSGRKGLKLPRINVAFAPDLYEYVRTMARVRGETLTDFVNDVLRQSMTENAEIYAKAIEFKNSI